jgi:hypothetical protein
MKIQWRVGDVYQSKESTQGEENDEEDEPV